MGGFMERQPAVAGQFYPGSAKTLKLEVDRYLAIDVTPRPAKAAIAPHAGYVYSGAVAGKVFASVEIPKTCIVLSPNHTGMGANAAIMASGSWRIPTGTIPVATAIAEQLMAACPSLTDDPTAHLAEHSLEVELPFLLARQPDLSIVPIALSRVDSSHCRAIGEAIAAVVQSTSDPILIVTSTDMNHYENQTRTMEKDRLAIDRVLAMDADGLLATCAEHRISMCGVIPTAVTIHAGRALGAKQAELVAHTTSGDVSGDMDAVVGYAGFIIE